ncbi:hypothetical protein [Oceanimonas marisflavi]|uniref:hypothetical protein n=1 Tax=Oceanimonas marisflavi TaxID=2059724 RepID=UPI000D3279C2|nr:hypothetical protein [Oceanimonas marisflavi]
MNKLWACGLMALLLGGCSSQMSFPFDDFHLPTSVAATDNTELLEWLQLSHRIMQSGEAERQQEMARLQQAQASNELVLALWLSHPKANLAQRQQAQQLFSKALPGVNTRLQQFFALHQAYNQELITFNRVVTDRQQQINTLTRKLNELATIDEQINERRYQENGQ